MIRKIGEIFQTKELMANLVRRDLNVKHRNSFLGFLWSFLNPLMMVIIYTFVFSYLLGIKIPQYPFALFLFCGLVFWNLFASSVASSVGSIVGNGYLIQKIYFPREVLPVSLVLSNLVNFLFELTILLGFILLAGVNLTLYAFLFLLILPLQLLFIMGISLIFATLNVYFRDVEHFTGIILQVWFWLTPIVYPLTMITQNYPSLFKFYMLNPMAIFILSYRNVLLDGQLPSFYWLLYALIVASITFILGYVLFYRYEPFFAEEV